MSDTHQPDKDYRIEDHFADLPLSNSHDFRQVPPPEEEVSARRLSIMDQSVKRVSIWGVRGSGKTTYLTALHRACRANQRVYLREADEESNRFIIDSEKLLNEGRFPRPTQAAIEYANQYRFQIFRKNYLEHWLERLFPYEPNYQTATLDLLDVAGEWFEEERFEQLKMQYPATAKMVEEYLLNSTGIIALFDPSRLLPSRSALPRDKTAHREATLIDLLHLMHRLRQLADKPYVEQPIAICITKIDRDSLWEHRNNAPALAEQIIEEEILHEIKKICRPGNYKFFAVSAIGVNYDEYGQPIENVVRDDPTKIRNPKAKPYGLLEPILWILDRI